MIPAVSVCFAYENRASRGLKLPVDPIMLFDIFDAFHETFVPEASGVPQGMRGRELDEYEDE